MPLASPATGLDRIHRIPTLEGLDYRVVCCIRIDVLLHHFNNQIPIRYLATALLASCALACSLVDDDQPPVADTGDTGPDEDVCLAQLETAADECLPGMIFHSMLEGGGGSMILIDDPGASVGVGPDAWLIQVGTEADYVASYQFEGATCSAGCGWCNPGESICHQGFDETGTPMGCLMCVPYGTPDMGTQCAAFMAACTGQDETGADDDGADETGAESDSGAMEIADPDAFDCRGWDLDDAVVLDDRGDVIIDAAIVELAAAHFGEPLAKCDGTRFRSRSDGYFEVSALSGNGLLARIGLQQGDVVLAVDGEPMRGADRVISKAMDLFMGAHPASQLTLVVRRGATTIDKLVRIR